MINSNCTRHRERRTLEVTLHREKKQPGWTRRSERRTEPRMRRSFSCAPPISPCARWPFRRQTRARRTVVRAAVQRVISPRLPSSSSRRLGYVREPAPATPSERRLRASRPADRAPPTLSCARRSFHRDQHAPCRHEYRRVSSDITTPVLLVASPARLCQSRRWRRRASVEPRASRRADRAPPASSYVRRSFHRRARAPCRVFLPCVG